ncbi:hypothetical protein BLTE_12020 [Blastochloris tepida]|uniref:Uncharacterized protein n=1 Tax=Blastochloris tepida TaxID=2233851 RepID=A0A348FYY4_9HYPH|nr:hypothetical protein BLTE_12020 [Blastochloris tepida]
MDADLRRIRNLLDADNDVHRVALLMSARFQTSNSRTNRAVSIGFARAGKHLEGLSQLERAAPDTPSATPCREADTTRQSAEMKENEANERIACMPDFALSGRHTVSG